MALSRRANDNLGEENIMMEGVIKVNSNPYNADTNANGIINMGVAENKLMTKELKEIMSGVDVLDPKLHGYGESPRGSKLLREHHANNIFNRYFNPHEPVLPDDIVITAGCSAAVDNFTFVVCDPGEGILISAPFYGGFNTDVIAKSKGKVIPVDLQGSSALDVGHIHHLQMALDKSVAEGVPVRAIIISNPHNPLGRNHSLEVIYALLQFADKNNIHILFDEIYALSVFDHLLTGPAKDEQPDAAPFVSVLSLPDLASYCKKELVHVAYGMSKDFCLNGFRCGAIVSPWNPRLLSALSSIAVFTWISSSTEALITKLLSDGDVIDKFTAKNQERLAESYTLATKVLRKNKIPFLPAQAGHFMWIDLRQYIPTNLVQASKDGNRGAELLIWRAMLAAGAYVNLGMAFTESQVGFFRLTFSIPPEMLQVGLDRMIAACEGLADE